MRTPRLLRWPQWLRPSQVTRTATNTLAVACACGWDDPEPHMLLARFPPHEGALVTCPGSVQAISLGVPVATGSRQPDADTDADKPTSLDPEPDPTRRSRTR